MTRLMRRVLTRERVAATFADPTDPLIEEIAGYARVEIDPRSAWPDEETTPRPLIRSRLRSMLAVIVGRR